jgi:hypothetical protein
MPSGEDEEIVERDETLLLVIALATAQSLRRRPVLRSGVTGGEFLEGLKAASALAAAAVRALRDQLG